MKQMTYEQALHRLAAYCSRAERCIYDIRLKMDLWEIPYNEQNRLIERLQKEKFLDEKRYCHAFVNDKIKYNHWGIYKIKYELNKKQIPESLIQEALEQIDGNENKELLIKLLRNKRRVVYGRNEFEIKQKLIRFAVGRGFSIEEIEKALERI
ncbi:MAG: RecX family transcriptional regulator [Dysgonamonadaceae bacterium]|jgi:regulatory protein|nr:RecX family transcriptional regulator [Dysgonamonadaceae bacterium]